MHSTRKSSRDERTAIHIAEGWEGRLADGGLCTFGDVWDLPQAWVDEPNESGDGWSGVSRHELLPATGQRVVVYVKRAQDYFLRCPIPLIPRALVMKREVRSLLVYLKLGIPAPELIAWGERRLGGVQQGFVITAALEGYVCLEDIIEGWREEGWPSLHGRRLWAKVVARFVRGLHDRGMGHNMLYPKHIFVNARLADRAPEALEHAREGDLRFIDLENSCRTKLRLVTAYRDLDRLNRHMPDWSRSDRLAFFRYYTGRDRLNLVDRFLFRLLGARARYRARKRARAT